MKKKGIGILLTCMALGAVLCGAAVPANAAELSASAPVQAAALKVSSYKGESLAVGERSMLVVSPYGTCVTAVSSNPGVIALEQISGCYVMVAKSAGTAEVSITDDAGNSAVMTMTVLGGEASPTPPPEEGSSPAQAPEDSDPVVNSEWSHNPDADLTANMEIRQEMVRLINQVRQEHGLPELPADDRLMNATQDVSTQHFKEHTRYEREAVIAYGCLPQPHLLRHGFGWKHRAEGGHELGELSRTPAIHTERRCDLHWRGRDHRERYRLLPYVRRRPDGTRHPLSSNRSRSIAHKKDLQ